MHNTVCSISSKIHGGTMDLIKIDKLTYKLTHSGRCCLFRAVYNQQCISLRIMPTFKHGFIRLADISNTRTRFTKVVSYKLQKLRLVMSKPTLHTDPYSMQLAPYIKWDTHSTMAADTTPFRPWPIILIFLPIILFFYSQTFCLLKVVLFFIYHPLFSS